MLLVAHCHLRSDRRTFKLDRIVRLMRVEGGVPVAAVAKDCGGEPDVGPSLPTPGPERSGTPPSEGPDSANPLEANVAPPVVHLDDARLTTPDPSPY